MNTNTVWDSGNVETSQRFSPQSLQDNFNSIMHTPVKLQYVNGQKPFLASDIHKPSDISSPPPLQPSPNIVDQITLSKNSPTCK